MSIARSMLEPPALQRSAMWGAQRNSTALAIHSLAGSLRDFYGISIAVIVHSLDPSLFVRLIVRYSLTCRIPTALAIHSLAGFLPHSLSTRLQDSYRTRYPLACWIAMIKERSGCIIGSTGAEARNGAGSGAIWVPTRLCAIQRSPF